jgi:hypothetical protein
MDRGLLTRQPFFALAPAFGEPPQGELRRIPLPRTRVKKGKEKSQGCHTPVVVRPTWRYPLERTRPLDGITGW